MMGKIKVVFLDVDDTLLDFKVCAKAAIEKMFAAFSLPMSETVFSVFEEINHRLWEEIEKNRLSREELFRIRWKLILEKLKMEGGAPEEMDNVFRRNLRDIAIPVEGAPALLQYLFPKYMLCVTSNSSYERQVERLTRADMLQYITHLFASDKIGHPKPEKAFFDACFDVIGGIKPEETVIIGDSLTADIAGGRNSGIKTIWFNFDGEAMPKDVQADYVVESLLEIKNIL